MARVLLLLLAAAPLSLPEVLRSLGDEAEKREKAPPCDYREVTLVEELNEDGSVKGSEERVYEGTLTGIEVTRRERRSVTPKGAALADLLQEPKGAKGKKPARSPFHSAMRSQFRFALQDGPAPDTKVVTLEPLKPDPERPRGEAVVRASDGRLEELRVSPSKVPFLLSALSIRFVFSQTACGHMATVIETEGRGDTLLADTRFRSRTVLESHAPVTRKK